MNRRMTDIAPQRLAMLNAGEAETTHLTECLAVDFAALMRSVLPGLDQAALDAMAQAHGEGITRRMALAATLIHERLGMATFDELRTHPADTVRGWACYLMGVASSMTLGERLAAIRPLADDAHFGVREWAWLALRPRIVAELDSAIAMLSGWTASPSERLRRFACESIRPRGVWCAHIAGLKRHPEQALSILTPLRADPARYVQDSVGNWLNDAAKDRPDWVRALCREWQEADASPATAYILKRAQRSLG